MAEYLKCHVCGLMWPADKVTDRRCSLCFRADMRAEARNRDLLPGGEPR